MLRTDTLSVFYDELQALIDVTLEVPEGCLLAVIGSNGAGKTTLLKSISGLLRPRQGRILFEGEPIQNEPTDRICMRGIVQVPEGRKLFPLMTVRENLEMGAYLPKAKAGARGKFPEIFRLFPILERRQGQLAGTLSGGEQQMLAIGRALMAGPRLLMLDEPSLGLSPKIASEIYATLGQLHAGGMTLMLVSQDVLQALKISSRAYVIENGRIVMEGESRELLGDPRVKEAYLGM
ncbi:MAG: ABC transporter ATP-binding protein [Deltaproteobacteria bacterium]|nr:ABC transporter ATP-binding protein [Deltaproteobacteria bacterium]